MGYINLSAMTPAGQAPNYSNPNAPNYISPQMLQNAGRQNTEMARNDPNTYTIGQNGEFETLKKVGEAVWPILGPIFELQATMMDNVLGGGGSPKGGNRATSSTTDLPIPVEHQQRNGSVLSTVLPSNPQPGNINANGGSPKGGSSLAQTLPASSSPTLGTSSTTPALPAPAPTTPSTNTNNTNSYRPFMGGLLGGFANLGNNMNSSQGSSWGSGSGAGSGLGSLLTGIGKK